MEEEKKKERKSQDTSKANQPGSSEKAKDEVPKAQGQGTTSRREDPKTTRSEDQERTNKGKITAIRVNSKEDVDRMSDDEIRKAKMSGISKAKVQKLVKQGKDYF